MTRSGSGQLASQVLLREAEQAENLDGFSIRIESPSSESVQGLVRESAEGGPETDDLRAPNAEFLVARLGGKPVGCIALVDHLRFGEARRLFVSEDMRGNGIAMALVEALEAAARDIGLRRIRIARTTGGRSTPGSFTSRGYRPTADTWMEKAL